MALRCLLFTSDPATAEFIRQVLSGLGVEGEHCPEAVAAVEQVTRESFQIVIIDWGQQAEARLLLTTARDRKAAERPLTLAIVSDDASVPQALQAGANSILRKPLLLNQVRDTLTTARDLLRARQESATNSAHAAAAASSATHVTKLNEPAGEKTLRAGDFLPSAAPAPGAQFETETEVHNTPDQAEHVKPLKELEPMAAVVAQEKPTLPPPPPNGEPRGLAWYLNARGVTQPPPQPSPQPAPPAPQPSKPELIGFDQTPSSSAAAAAPAMARSADPATEPTEQEQRREQKNEAALFSYMAGETTESEQPTKSRFLGKGPIIGALVLAACAIVAAPQAPWHPKLQGLWGRSKKATHTWLNPQPVTTVPAPVAHEDFGRAGDEYKLPVAESIPDATTDPSQIRVTPVVDPTLKKPNNGAANPDQTGQPDGTSATPTDPSDTPAQTAPDNQPESQPQISPPATAPSSSPDLTPATPPVSVQPHSDPPAAAPASSTNVQPAPPKNPQPHYTLAPAPPRVPSSLKSQMASMTPEASGNKPPEAAMASIEPVAVPEAAERALLSDQPAIAYPASAKGQQGIVVLQILVGRDGTVQDAKFQQGALAFARTAIDGVKLWKFKPYTMNGRPVSVQTVMTISFKPGQ